jgi:hypothetical protein
MTQRRFGLIVAAGLMAGSLLAQTNTSAGPTAEIYHGLADKKMPEITDIIPGLNIGVLVEVEAEYVRQGGKDTSDAKLSTMEFGADFKPVDWAEGHILFLWEEGTTEPIDLDEATITMGKTETIPLFMTAGRQYVPFGVFNSHFVSDPLVQVLGETRATAVLAGYENEILTASVGAFRGNQIGQDKVNNTVGALVMRPYEGIEFGMYAMSDLGESKTLRDETRKECEDYEKAPGVGGYASLSAWLLHLDAEVLGATKAFQAGIFKEDAELKPRAWNVELAVRPIERLELAGRIEGGKDLLPAVERQFGGAASFGIVENLTLTVEYLHAQYEDDTEAADAVRGKLAARF